MKNNEILLNKITSLIKEKKSIDFSKYKTNTLLRRLRQRISIAGFNSLEDYYTYLIENFEKELDVLSNYFLINTSEFFRDPIYYYYFDYLVKNKVNKGAKYIKVLSIGCSSGEEPYTCAMILNERKDRYPEIDYHIDAFDIDEVAIEEAKKAVYMEHSLENIPYFFLKKYFIKQGTDWKLNTSFFKKNISFFHKDILKIDFSFGGLFKYDFVFVRNVFLYFKEEEIEYLITKIMDILERGGYMILGHSEHIPMTHEQYFLQICKEIRIFMFKEKILLEDSNYEC